MRVTFIFAWYDLWIGAFWDKAKRRLYIFPVPMFGFYIQFKLAVVPEQLPEYFVIVQYPVQALTKAVNEAIAQGYVPLGPPVAQKVQPDPRSAAYYQWAQAVILKK